MNTGAHLNSSILKPRPSLIASRSLNYSPLDTPASDALYTLYNKHSPNLKEKLFFLLDETQ